MTETYRGSVGYDHLLSRSDAPLEGPGTLELRDGIVAAIVPDAGGPGVRRNRLVLPALSNVHDHGRGMRTLAFGALDDALEIWLTRLGLEPMADPYLRAVVAFGRMAESGIGILNHCHNTQDVRQLEAEAAAVKRAANAVGVRVAFAVPLLGANPVAYGDPAALYARLPEAEARLLGQRAAGIPAFDDQLAVAESLFDLQDDLFSVQYGPVAPQWVDDATLRRVAERSALHGRRIHMHLLETRLQREWADAVYPRGLLHHLDEIGLLSPRLTVAHGTHLTAAECELLAERGVSVSVNASSNLRLRSGIAPVADFVASGVKFGLGLDGMSFDDDEDGLREMRLIWHLNRGFGVNDILSRERLLQAVFFDGRDAILGPGSAMPLGPGSPADLMVVDTARISRDVIPGRAGILDLLLTRATKADVDDLWVAGRRIVRNGTLASLPLAALEAEFTDRARHAARAVDWPSLDRIAQATRQYYGCGCHTGRATMPGICTADPR
ncbi:MAG: amidohydrolase family protein [Ancalomicrobiaceae bacterium]|nr:amidohydrolase family protein [Ancalomicrobiaceae bacterium]